MTDLNNITVRLTETSFNVKANKIDGNIQSTDPITVKNQIQEIHSIDDLGLNVTNRGDGSVVVYNANTQQYDVRPFFSSPVDPSVSYSWTNVHTFNANVVFNSRVLANSSGGTSGQVLTSSGNGVYWSTSTVYTFSTGLTNTSNTITVNAAYIATISANNASFLGGNPSSFFAANSSLANYYLATNPAGYVNSTSGSANSSVFSNNASFLGGKSEATLNVNNAVTANDSSYLGGNLPSFFAANSSLANYYLVTNPAGYVNATSGTAGSANNASFLGGNAPSFFAANSSLANYYLATNPAGYVNATSGSANNAFFSNSASFLLGKSEANLNVNNAIFANNSLFLNGLSDTFFAANSSLLNYYLVTNPAGYVNSTSGSANSSLFSNNASFLGGNLPSFYTNATNIISGTIAEPRLPFRMNQNVTSTSDVQFGNMTLTGNLTIGGSVTTISANNLSITDNMFYLNNGIDATITNISGNGTVVSFTANNNFSTGWDVVVTGVNPTSYNGIYQNILLANATHFQISNNNNAAYVSGGSARGKSDLNPDIGFAAGYNDGTYHHTGFFRDHTNGTWKVFENYTPEPDESIYIDQTHASYRNANFMANTIFVGNNTVFATINSTSFSGTANNATYAFGQSSALSLNVNSANSAIYANNANYLNGYTWASPASIGGTTANSGNFTSVNAASHTVGTTFVANSTYLLTTGAVRIANGGISANAWAANGIGFIQTNATYTDLTSSGTVATTYVNLFGAPTVAATNTTTYTNLYNTWFNDPLAGTNVTATNRYALGADSAYINGSIRVQGSALIGVNTTTGTITLGSSIMTGVITVGSSTASQTTNIQAAATVSGQTKTINLGTAGLSGSFTNITIGSGAGGQSNVIVNGTMSVNGAIVANGSLGTSGQILTSTESGVYWSSTANSALYANNAQFLGGLPPSAYTTTSGTIENANKLNNQPASFYTNATNITTGTLQPSVVPSYAVNTSGAFTIGGVLTYNANIAINANGSLVFSANSKIYDASGSRGTQGQVLSIDASNNISWAAFASTASSDANNANYLGNNAPSYYTNATNINTGTLSYAQLGPNVVNTTSNFAISGIYTYNSNIVIGSTGGLVFNTGAKLYDSLGAQGTAGQVLASNGAGNLYWTSIALLSNNDLFVNTTASYTFTNTAVHTHQANIVIGSTGGLVFNGGSKLYDSRGSLGTAGQVLATNGSIGTANLYWTSIDLGSLQANNATYLNGQPGPSSNVVGISDIQTLTNKRIQPRTNTQVISVATTITPDISLYSEYNFTSMANSVTIAIPTGTPIQGDKLLFRFNDNGVAARPIFFTVGSNGAFRNVGSVIPANTSLSKTTYVGCLWNSFASRWDVVTVIVEV